MSFKTARLLAKLTQEQVAAALNLSRTTVSMWESGESLPRASMLPALASILGCSIDDLFQDNEQDQIARGA